MTYNYFCGSVYWLERLIEAGKIALPETFTESYCNSLPRLIAGFSPTKLHLIARDLQIKARLIQEINHF